MKKTFRTMGRPKLRARATGVTSRFATLSRDIPISSSLEEGRRRMRSLPDFFASLSPEALEMIKNHEGPDFLGPPDSKFKL